MPKTLDCLHVYRINSHKMSSRRERQPII